MLLKRRNPCQFLISRGWAKSTGEELTHRNMLNENGPHGIDGGSRRRTCSGGHGHLHLLHRRTSSVFIRLQLFITLNDGLAVDIFRHYTPVSARFLTTRGQLFLPRGPSIHGHSPLDVNVVAWPSERSGQKGLPPVRLDLGSSAVDEKFDTRDEAGVIRRQKQRDLGNFLRFSHASHR